MHPSLKAVRGGFRPGLVPTLATLVLLIITISAGNWQMRRADYKRHLAARLDAVARLPPVAAPLAKMPAGDYLYRRMQARGRFDVAHQILIDNQTRGRVVGYEVVTPLAIDGSPVRLLVDRGFVPAGNNRRQLPDVITPSGEVTVDGIVTVPPKKYFELSQQQQVAGAVWENLRLDRYARGAPWPVQPFVLVQLSDLPDHLSRRFERPDLKIGMHLGYAAQWYAMAVALAVIYVALNLRRKKHAQ